MRILKPFDWDKAGNTAFILIFSSYFYLSVTEVIWTQARCNILAVTTNHIAENCILQHKYVKKWASLSLHLCQIS